MLPIHVQVPPLPMFEGWTTTANRNFEYAIGAGFAIGGLAKQDTLTFSPVSDIMYREAGDNMKRAAVQE